ncbi:N-acetylmuramoyl-L-alanine amidase [Clostridium perfringens]|uniref:N-acetylmuramoyl-L-alanine amidase n=1 Tax=Clostridium perfringens TaxID=1502 RepID=UPI0024486C36|nr:N-acetylmuramoyl-L-alanine amidase [Clostridium perfringens]MDH2338721.1 N-acetylmuramoyl-L-alanine amidase [Clostridium perfringens]
MSKRVWLDAGHGGKDSGACANGLREKDINLTATLECRNVLVSYGVEVGMTRTTDVFYELNERCRMANKFRADVFVSLHTNAGGGDGAEAIHSIHYGMGTELAKNMVAAIKEYTPQNLRPRATYSKANSSGNADYFAVIRNTNMSASIIEMAFIDSIDHEVIDTIEEQKAMGRAIAYGILKTLGINFSPNNSAVSNGSASSSNTSPQVSHKGFYESNETRTNATLVGEGSIKVLDEDCNPIPGRCIDSLDNLFVLGIYPSRKFIEVIYPAGDKKYHAYIGIEYYNRISFDYHKEYINDDGVTYVWWNASDVNVKDHNEELQPKQKASPMYRTGEWLRITFYRENGVPSDGYVRYEGSQNKKFYESIQYGIVKVNSSLNVRETPNGEVIGSVYKDEKVQVLKEENGWYYIEYSTSKGKKRGYVSSKYIELV